MRAWLVLLLVAPAWAGCLGAANEPAHPEPLLLSALTMDDASVVDRSASLVTFRWESALGPGAGGPLPGMAWRTAAFDLPVTRVLASAELAWETAGAELELVVMGQGGARACADAGPEPLVAGLPVSPTPAAERLRACTGPIVVPGPARGEVRVGGQIAQDASVPFVLTLTLSIPSRIESVTAAAPCVHPWPCADGSEWPIGLTGPFDLLEDTRLEIPSHDGVLLSARLWRPDLPPGVGAPTILVSDPYLGDPESGSNLRGARLAEEDLVPNGYAFLLVSVRGTAASGGCFDHHAMDSQLDPAAMVDWIARQPWSNGRVGMHGLSYMGVTSVHGALHAGPALKAILVAGVPQAYLYHHTPQGAFATSGSLYEANQHNVETPPVSWDPELIGPTVSHLAERGCEEYQRNLLVEPMGQWTDDRDPAFWEERDMYRRYPNATAAIFIAEGYHDAFIPWGQEVAWDMISAPKRMLYGQWGHRMPPLDAWRIDQLAWFDHWLKGVGEPPGVGTMTFQDDARAWHRTTAWPSPDVREEVIYLHDGVLDGRPGGDDASYRSAPQRGAGSPADVLCAGATVGSALVYRSSPRDSPALLAGNAFASLRITSDGSSGLVGAYLFNIPAGAACADARLLAWGAADLRFHEGNLIGKDFPVGEATQVRIDFEPTAARFEVGDQLGVVIAYPGPYDDRDVNDPTRILPSGPGSNGRSGRPAYPLITLHAGGDADASHLVLPLLEGAFGGGPPTLAYPPRPFVPSAG